MIRFAKAHACGNDFLIVEAALAAEGDRGALARAMCARTTGLGADGVEYLTLRGEREGRIHLYNADGSAAELSGNGTRCVAAWMAEQAGLSAGVEIRLETDAGPRVCRLDETHGAEFDFTTGMGAPKVQRKTVQLEDLAVEGAVVDMGNPHFVVQVKDESFRVSGGAWQAVGAAICAHLDFPAGTNVEFVRRLAESRLDIRIYERGVGPTASSGTGTSASAAAMIALEGAPSRLRVLAPGGEQVVEWQGGAAELWLTGPATVVARGEWLAGGKR